MKIVFMVEEPSMKALLDNLLLRIIPDVDFLVIPHNGKGDLAKSIPRKLRKWPFPKDKFVIVHDQDSNDCIKLKEGLKLLCESSNSKNEYLIRIVCVELEAWYFGDLKAVSLAYGKDLNQYAVKRKFREPDKIVNAKEELRRLVPTYQPIDGAKKISAFMDVENNTSYSFNIFVNGVKGIVK